MSSSSRLSTRLNISVRHTVVSLIISAVAVIVNVLQISVPLLLLEAVASGPAGGSPGRMYLLTLPIYVVPIVNLLGLVVGVCTPFFGWIIHGLCCILGAGTILYHWFFLSSKLDDNLKNFVVPLVVMCVTLLLSVVKCVDDFVTFIEREILKKRNSKREVNEYLQVDSFSDSDEEVYT